MAATVIIPARLDSRRLPEKVLALLDGVPMVVRVMERASSASHVERVVVATSDQAVAQAVEAAGGEVVWTRSNHVSGSDRVAEAARNLGLQPDDFVVNVQGDEPFLDPVTVDKIVQRLQSGACAATAASPLRGDPNLDSVVKVVADTHGQALYFSRQPIPSNGPWLQHIGIYGYKVSTLWTFTEMPLSALEGSERLEQLRLLENGLRLDVVQVEEAALSVDTREDLDRARTIMAEIHSQSLV